MLQALPAVVWPIPHGLEIGGYVFPPLLTALAYAFALGDSDAAREGTIGPWERFLERAWAVIIIDFVTANVSFYSLALTASGDFLAIAVGFAGILLSTAIVFADTSATADDGVSVWLLVPHAFVASVRTALQPTVFMRAVVLFSLNILAFALAQSLLAALTQAHVPHADFWSLAVVQTLATVPLAVLTMLIYRDAVRAAAEPPA